MLTFQLEFVWFAFAVEEDVWVELLKYLLCHSILLPVITFKHHEPNGNIRAQLEYLMKVS